MLMSHIHVPLDWVLAAPGVIFYLLRFLTRWFIREHLQRLARSWPTAGAVVQNSFELAEADRGRWGKPVAVWAVAIQYAYKVNGEFYSGTYFLPRTYLDAGLATEAGRAWVGRHITIRHNPSKLERSVFLESDGAPGKPHIPARANRRGLTTLSLGQSQN